MKVIVCTDNQGGTMFNCRRQSKDRILRKHILDMVRQNGNGQLWVNQYSAKQFDTEQQSQLHISEDYLKQAEEGEYAFVEDGQILAYEDRVEAFILFRWNRDYPADTFFDISLADHGWKLIETSEFVGHSHTRITKEVYTR